MEPGSSPHGPNGSPGRTARRLAVAAVAVVALVGGGTGAALLLRLAGSSEQLLGRVPADVHGFVTIYLDPGAGQKLNLRRIAEAFPALGGTEGLDRRTGELLDELTASFGLDYQEDVEPWLGSQVGVAFRVEGEREHAVAMLVASADDRLAAAALDRSAAAGGDRTEIDGVEVVEIPGDPTPTLAALVDGAVVVADDRAFLRDVIAATRGEVETLAGSEDYLDSTAPLPRSRLLLGWVDPAGLVSKLAEVGALGEPSMPGGALPGVAGVEAIRGVGFSVSAESEGLAVTVNQRYDPAELSDEQREALEAGGSAETLLPAVPADAFALAASSMGGSGLPEGSLPGVPGLGEVFEGLTGDLAIEVGPGDRRAPAAGALLLGVRDAEAVRTALRQLEALLPLVVGSSTETGGSLGEGEPVGTPPPAFAEWQRTEHRGVEIRYLELPEAEGFVPAYAVTDEVVVIASSLAEARQVLDTLAEGPSIADAGRFARATDLVGIEGPGLGFLDVEGLLAEHGSDLEPEQRENLAPIRAVAAASRGGFPDATSQVFVLIEAAG